MQESGINTQIAGVLTKFIAQLGDEKLADSIMRAISWLDTATETNLIRTVASPGTNSDSITVYYLEPHNSAARTFPPDRYLVCITINPRYVEFKLVDDLSKYREPPVYTKIYKFLKSVFGKQKMEIPHGEEVIKVWSFQAVIENHC